MTRLRVRSLALALSMPEPCREAAPRVRETLETRFMPAVLAALRAELDGIFGSRAVIRIARLHLRLSIGPETGDALALAQRIGRDLAEQIRAMARIVPEGAPIDLPDAQVRVWTEAGGYLAAALCAAAADRPGPERRRVPMRSVLAALTRAPPDTAARAIAGCHAARALPGVLDAMPAAERMALVRRVTGLLEPTVRAALRDAAGGATAPEQAPGGATEPGGPRPPADVAPRKSAGRPDHASAPQQPNMPETGHTAPSATEAPMANGHARVHPAVAREDEAFRPPAVAREEEAFRPPADTPESAAPRTGSADNGAQPHHERPVAAPPEPAPPVRDTTPASDEAPAVFPTRWGGLAYLLNIALRLDLPQALWQIGVREGAVLAAMLGAAVQAPEDAAARVLTPEFPKAPRPLEPLPGWARQELVAKAVAAGEGWTGQPCLAARVETVRAGLAQEDGWHPGDWGGALLLSVFADLLKASPDLRALRARLAIPGEVVLRPGMIVLDLPQNAVDIDVRRLALDADPGHLPWLDRRMVLRFGPECEEWPE